MKTVKPGLLASIVFGFAVVAFADVAAADPVRVGDMEIYPLVDVTGKGSPKGIVVGVSDAELEKLGEVERTIFAYVVKFPHRTVLFDSGLGATANGKVLESLKAAGMSPADIDEIFVTHMHGDHIGGLIDADGRPVYPKARIYIGRIEKTWWLDRAREFDAYAKNAALAHAVVGAYPARVAIFEFGSEVLPGVTAVDARGHTPGHTVYSLESGGGKILIVGDIMHFADLQFANPDITVTYDVDQKQAAVARKRILKLAADNDLPIAGMHLPLPGIWRVKADGKGFAKVAYR